MRAGLLVVAALAAMPSARADAQTTRPVPALAAPDDPLICPPPIDEQGSVEERARAHYERGTELYAQGEYELAIPEFRATYCLVPVPDAIHAVAQAYERLVSYESAVVWFQAYLRALPDTAENKVERTNIEHRLRVLRSLPARLRVATTPPGATLRFEGIENTDAHKEARADEKMITLGAGTYRLHIELEGYQPIDETLRAEIGQPYSYTYQLVRKTGTLRISANPPEARILIDDKVVGNGSYGDRLPAGRHEVVLEAEGRPPEHRTVDLGPDEVVTLHLQMKPESPRNGKVELLIGSTMYGVLEGTTVGAGFFTDELAITSFGVIGGVLGFVAPYFVFPGELAVGRTSLILGAHVWGAVAGLGLASTIYGANDLDAHQGASGLLTVGGAVAFAATAAYVGSRFGFSAGDTALFNSGALWGSAAGFMAWLAFGQDGRLGGPMVLAGVTIGMLTGGVLAGQYEFSRGHVALIDLAGVGGLITGFTLANILKQNDTPTTTRFALGGTVIGLIAGALLSSGTDEAPMMPATGVAIDSAGHNVFTMGLQGRF